MEKKDLEPVFRAWYDHKMEPDDPELQRLHRSTLEAFKSKLETLAGYPMTIQIVRQTIGPRFGAWMIENGLPKPPK